MAAEGEGAAEAKALKKLSKDVRRRAKEEKRTRAAQRHTQALAHALAAAAEAAADGEPAGSGSWEDSVIALVMCAVRSPAQHEFFSTLLFSPVSKGSRGAPLAGRVLRQRKSRANPIRHSA